jgi:pyruvate/oxaloacetate carboxyltransferase
MSNEITDALTELGKGAFDIWQGNSKEVFARFTPEEKALALRVAKRAAQSSVVTIMSRGESALDKANIDNQVARLTVGLALDEREVIRNSFWPSITKAITDGVGMLLKLLK